MKAIILTQPGGTEYLSMQDIDRPQPGPADVLIKVHAISINPVDIKTRKGGALYNTMKEQPPAILGWDIAGSIAAIGADVTGFSVGDKVFGMVNFPGHGRAYAQYVVAPAAHLAHIPSGISYAQAAATTLAALTAWQVLVHQAGIKAGQHVLIHAAAGGVGHFAVQIAKHLGATVSGTASPANADFLRQLGADHHIDYTTGHFIEQVKDVDIVLDPIGGDTTAQSLQVLKPGGTIISIVGGIKDPLRPAIEEKHINAQNYLVHSSGADMEQLASLLAAGNITPHISHTFPFHHMAQAHQQIETGKTRGKIIVDLPADE